MEVKHPKIKSSEKPLWAPSTASLRIRVQWSVLRHRKFPFLIKKLPRPGTWLVTGNSQAITWRYRGMYYGRPAVVVEMHNSHGTEVQYNESLAVSWYSVSWVVLESKHSVSSVISGMSGMKCSGSRPFPEVFSHPCAIYSRNNIVGNLKGAHVHSPQSYFWKVVAQRQIRDSGTQQLI